MFALYCSHDQLLQAADDIWWRSCEHADWVESFNSRPLIGDRESFKKDPWCAAEDAHVINAPQHVADELIACNKPYMDKARLCMASLHFPLFFIHNFFVQDWLKLRECLLMM